jgi:hypothetical protein
MEMKFGLKMLISVQSAKRTATGAQSRQRVRKGTGLADARLNAVSEFKTKAERPGPRPGR